MDIFYNNITKKALKVKPLTQFFLKFFFKYFYIFCVGPFLARFRHL